MSSSELPTIFENAAGIISIRLTGHKGTAEVLSEVGRLLKSEERNPLDNRDLIIDPDLFSQQLRVPSATVEAVMAELRRFNFAHIWVRVTCPVVDSDDDNVIVETDDVQTFRQAIAEVCGHCGQFHGRDSGLGWDSLETFYALHFDGKEDRFRLGRFFIPAKILAPDEHPKPAPKRFVWLRSITRFFASWARKPAPETPVETVDQQLQLNQPNSQVPSSIEMGWRLALLIVGMGIFTALVFLGCRAIYGTWTAMVVVAVLTLATALAAYVVLACILAVGAVRRMLLSSGFVLSGTLFASSVEWHVQAGENVPWEARAGWGQVSVPLASLAVLVYLITSATFIAYEYVTGWFSQNRPPAG